MTIVCHDQSASSHVQYWPCELYHSHEPVYSQCNHFQSGKLNSSMVTPWLAKKWVMSLLKTWICTCTLPAMLFLFLTHMIARVSFECWRITITNSHNWRMPVFLYKQISITSSRIIGHGLSECTMASHECTMAFHGLWNVYHEIFLLS